MIFHGLVSTVSRLQEVSLLFTNKFPGIPGTYLINLRRMKDRVDLEFPGANTQKNAINSLKFRGSVLWNH